MRIDAHVHYTSPTLAEDIERFSESEPLWGYLLNPGLKRSPIQGWATDDRMIADMDAAGLDRVVLVGAYRLRHESCVHRNNQGLELLRKWPNRVISFVVLQPAAGQAALDELKRCLDGGMQGVGELNPYGANLRLDHPDFIKVVEACIEFDIPLNLHINEEVGHYYPGKSPTPLSHYYQLIERYPELKLILAHWGGGLLFYELMPRVQKTLSNVWYDTAASPLLFPSAAIFPVALQCVDHKKILYGSDYPLLLYPGVQKEPEFRPFLNEIHELDLDSQVVDDILGDNAARLLGLINSEISAGDERGPTPRGGSMDPGRSDFLGQPDQIQAVEMRAGPAADSIPQPVREPAAEDGSQIYSKSPPQLTAIEPFMAVQIVANTWPETRVIFESCGIPWEDSPVPYWEPIAQAAAARGYSPSQRQRIIDRLNEAISG